MRDDAVVVEHPHPGGAVPEGVVEHAAVQGVAPRDETAHGHADDATGSSQASPAGRPAPGGAGRAAARAPRRGRGRAVDGVLDDGLRAG